MLHTSRAKLDLRNDGTGSFMRFHIYHAQPDGLTVSPACLGALTGFLSANNRGLFALGVSFDNDLRTLARNQPQRGRLHHSCQLKALPPTMTQYDRETHRPSQIAVYEPPRSGW